MLESKKSERSPLISGWYVPRSLKVRSQCLQFKFDKYFSVDPTLKEMKGEVLIGFIKLKDAKAEAIQNFAKKWGVLGLCKHGHPQAHEIKKTDPNFFYQEGCEPEIKEGWYTEPLDRWRDYAALLNSILHLANALHAKKIGSKNDWDLVRAGKYRAKMENYGHLEDGATWDLPVNLIVAEIEFASLINRFIRMVGIRPEFWWANGAQSIVLRPSINPYGLFSTLIIQTLLEVNKAPDYAWCPACGKPFFLRKGQRIGQRSWCESCGREAAQRDAVRKYARKRRGDHPPGTQRGKLSENEARAIKKILEKHKGRKLPSGLLIDLAGKYNVSTSLIYKIKEGKAWSST